MKEIEVQALVKYKQIPFNVYNEKGQIVIHAGDLLTPGRLIELKNTLVLFYDENYENKPLKDRENQLIKERREREKTIKLEERTYGYGSDTPTSTSKEEAYFVLSKDTRGLYLSLYREIMEDLENRNYLNVIPKATELTSLMEKEVISKINKIKHLLQLKIQGDYKICHPLNVALFSGFISKVTTSKVDMKAAILSGLLHDVGKTRLDPNIAYKSSLYVSEQANVEKHVIIGYKIIKEIFKLGNTIARPALEHHLYLDSSGYPKEITSYNITDISKILLVCNQIDNISSNRTPKFVNNGYEIGKILLNEGTQKYPADILYTTVNKYLIQDKEKLN